MLQLNYKLNMNIIYTKAKIALAKARAKIILLFQQQRCKNRKSSNRQCLGELSVKA